jgi:hypothetical protein
VFTLRGGALEMSTLEQVMYAQTVTLATTGRVDHMIVQSGEGAVIWLRHWTQMGQCQTSVRPAEITLGKEREEMASLLYACLHNGSGAGQ